MHLWKSWIDHQKLKFKLFIFLVSQNVYLVIYGFWYDYVQPKYVEKAKLCYMDTGSFMVYVKTEDIYLDIAKYVKTRLDPSNYELDRPLPKGINQKVLGLVKNELCRKVMRDQNV